MNTGRSGIEQLRNSYFRAVDYWLIVPILTLTMIGLFVLNHVLSSGYKDYPQNFYKQAGAAVLGICVALVICLVETHFLKLIGWCVYSFSLLLLLLVPIDGFSMEAKWGADSWLRVPVIGTFQPSELSKIGLILVVSFVLEDMAEKRITKKRGFLYLHPLHLGTEVSLLLPRCILGDHCGTVRMEFLFFGHTEEANSVAPLLGLGSRGRIQSESGEERDRLGRNRGQYFGYGSQRPG